MLGRRLCPEEAATVRGRRDAVGFTIIELLIVILILAILAGLVAPAAARGFRQSRMNSAAAQVGTALRRARSLAITRGIVHRVDFVNDDMPKAVIVAPLESDPENWTSLEGAGGTVLPQGTRLNTSRSSSSIATPASVHFWPDGSAWSATMGPPSAFFVVPDAEHAQSGIDDSRQISIGSLSGSISVLR